jgi:hypothetical protein
MHHRRLADTNSICDYLIWSIDRLRGLLQHIDINIALSTPISAFINHRALTVRYVCFAQHAVAVSPTNSSFSSIQQLPAEDLRVYRHVRRATGLGVFSVRLQHLVDNIAIKGTLQFPPPLCRSRPPRAEICSAQKPVSNLFAASRRTDHQAGTTFHVLGLDSRGSARHPVS